MTSARVGARAPSEDGKAPKPRSPNRRTLFPASSDRASLLFGPWSPAFDPVERVAQLRSLAAPAAVFLGAGHPLAVTLGAAELDSEAAAPALDLLDRIPSLTRRRMLATFARGLNCCRTGRCAPRGPRVALSLPVAWWARPARGLQRPRTSTSARTRRPLRWMRAEHHVAKWERERRLYTAGIYHEKEETDGKTQRTCAKPNYSAASCEAALFL